MLAEQLSKYRNLITLKDGARILLRLLTPEDGERLRGLFAHVTPEDARYLRDPVSDAATTARWTAEVNYARVLPLVAVIQDRIVGDATLHFGDGPRRHVGELRIFLAKDFRRRGLGTHMLRTLVELGRKSGLTLLAAEVVADQPQVIKAIRELGFQPQCTYEDFFMFPDGETTDVVMLTMRLAPHQDEF